MNWPIFNTATGPEFTSLMLPNRLASVDAGGEYGAAGALAGD